MPMFNEIGQPRFNSALIRTFAMKIGGAAAPTLAPEIAPSIDVNQQDDPALFFLRNERLCARVNPSVVAAVSNYSRTVLRNPATSGVLIIVEQCFYVSSNAGFALVSSGMTDDATVGASYVCDMRWPLQGYGSPTGVVSYGNASSIAPAAGNGQIHYFTANDTQYREVVAVLPPGAGLYLYVGAVNTALMASGFKWRERPITNEELQTG